jgi:sulfoxide reductase heme-binding subunit YedZ
MGPELAAAVAGRHGSVADISASTADVLGTSAFLMFATMLVVTPLHTLTGWRWHLVLRRDFGLGMFAVAGLDLTLAASTTGDTFPGGLLTRMVGHTFLAVGTLSVLLLVPVAGTAHLRAQRWLGPHWKWVHRLTYVVWGTILLHLLLLFGLRSFFLDALVISAPLVLLRVPVIRGALSSWRRAGTHALLRRITTAATIGILVFGYEPFVRELARVGVAAFLQHPPTD